MPSFPRRRESSASAPLSDRSLSGAEGKNTFIELCSNWIPAFAGMTVAKQKYFYRNVIASTRYLPLKSLMYLMVVP